MKFTRAADVEQCVWEMKLADFPRAQNRARIDFLFDGGPPYTDQEAAQNNLKVNYNDLNATKIDSDARGQWANALQNPGRFFTVNVDYGPQHLRQGWSERITNAINRRMKKSKQYYEMQDSIAGLAVLHGIGPSSWEDREKWCPTAHSIGDLMVPSATLRSLENLEHFAIFRKYTAAKLWRMTNGPKVDPAWNTPLVRKCLEWAHKQRGQTYSWGDYIYNPERMEQDFKENAGIYASDQTPTIDCFDFYFWNDSEKTAGWNRRIILDTPTPSESGAAAMQSLKDAKTQIGTRGEFLYNSGDRKYGPKHEQIVHFQFADASAVAPFRYHSVRSLGFLLYAVCHLQNRLNCRFNEHVFENLLQYFRVANADDVEKAKKIDLVSRGVIPDGVMFVKQDERWQINLQLVETAVQNNNRSMALNSSSFAQKNSLPNDAEKRKTATEVIAESSSASALVGQMLGKAYLYEEFRYNEICRRFCIKNSKDKDVRSFRNEVLKDGVPEEALNPERWEVKAERVMAGGNKQLAIAQANMLMEKVNLFDPDSQTLIKRRWVYEVTSDPAMTEAIVPMKKTQVSQDVHDAEAAVGTLMLGFPMDVGSGQNHVEWVETLLKYMSLKVVEIEKRGGMATEAEIKGLMALAQHIGAHLQIIAQDKNEKQRVTVYQQDLSKLMNMVKAYGQRLAQQQQAQQPGDNGGGEGAVKLQTQMLLAQNKARLATQSHAQRTAQRQIDFQMKQKQEQDRHMQQMQQRQAELTADMAERGIKAGLDATHSRLKFNREEE